MRCPVLVSTFRILLLAVAFAAGAHAATPPVVSCPWYSPSSGDSFAQRGFYTGLGDRGTTMKQVTLLMSFPAAGAYQLSLTAIQTTFDGTVLGTATANVSAAGTDYQAVVFDFGTVALSTTRPRVVFKGAVVSKPSGVTGDILFETNTAPSCPVFETVGFDAPISSYRSGGIAIEISGDIAPTFKHIVTVPAAASIHGANGTFFHTDVWLNNGGPTAASVTATYRCYQGQSCGSGTATFSIDPGKAKTIADAVGSLFNAPETAGAIEFSYDGVSFNNQLKVVTRTYSPSLPNPTTGAGLDGRIFIDSSGFATFVGLANNGGDRSSGFRTNAGLYNPNNYPTSVTFRMTKPDGTAIGQPITQTWGPNEARQVNDIFAALGAGSLVTTDAVLHVTSTLSAFPYVTVIDNVTGDSVIQE